MVLPVYECLQEAEVRKALGVSAAQWKHLQEIAARYATEFEKLGNTTKDQEEFQQKCKQAAIEVRRQIELLLTAKQLTALKDIVFRTSLLAALTDSKVQEKLELNDGQNRDLVRIRQDAGDRMYQSDKARKEKILDALTPQQRQKLREALDRRK